tara:strand:- start:868 stop:1857 length:990 start_codon:yes stop_codon:yes gene_type:complete
MAKNQYIVGAYTTSPNLYTWNESSELRYYMALKSLKSIKGLELPFWGESIHPFDDNWLFNNIDPEWNNLVTCIPGTMKRLEIDPYFGLGSKKEKSRKEAINFYSLVYKCVNELKIRFGENVVTDITIASSPYVRKEFRNSSLEKFIPSLVELVSWDWGNTKIVIEHCDALTSLNLEPIKGFLTLQEEITAIKEVNNKMLGIGINWGRSVIEEKSIQGPIEHIKETAKNNLLYGLMFSGTSNNNNNFYGKWSDLHMPPAKYKNYEYFEQESLMTYGAIKQALIHAEISSLSFLGIKLLAKPDNSSIEKRIKINKNTMHLLDDVQKEITTL